MTIVQVLFFFRCETFFEKCLQNSAAKLLYLIKEGVMPRNCIIFLTLLIDLNVEKSNSEIIFSKNFPLVFLCRSNLIDLILNRYHFYTYVVCHSTFWIFDAFFQTLLEPFESTPSLCLHSIYVWLDTWENRQGEIVTWWIFSLFLTSIYDYSNVSS